MDKRKNRIAESVGALMDHLDAVQLELEEALERLANAANAVAYQLERVLARLKESNDKPNHLIIETEDA